MNDDDIRRLPSVESVHGTLAKVEGRPGYHDCWFWCRRHHRPEPGGWTMINCVRVGPFVSEDEAEAVGVALGVG